MKTDTRPADAKNLCSAISNYVTLLVDEIERVKKEEPDALCVIRDTRYLREVGELYMIGVILESVGYRVIEDEYSPTMEIYFR